MGYDPATDHCVGPRSFDKRRNIISSTEISTPAREATPVHAARKNSSSLEFTSLRDLYTEPYEEVSYLVDDLIPMGGLSVLAGKPKAGKSTLVRDLIASVTRGTEFLSRPTQQGGVLYLALEEKKSEIVRHFKALGLTEDSPLSIHSGSAGDRKLAVAEIASLVRDADDVALLVIDPLFHLLPVRDQNEYAAVYQELEKLMEIARNTGTAIVAVHHAKKVTSNDVTDGALGSTAIAAAADTFMLLEEKGSLRLITTRQRYGPSLEQTQLVWDPDSRRMTLGQTSQITQEQHAIAAERRLKDEIEGFIAAHPGCSQEDVFKGVTGKTLLKTKALNALLEADRVSRNGAGHRGNPFTYKKTAEDEPIISTL